MKKTYIIHLFLFFLPLTIYSQLFDGKLIDSISKIPVSDVNIYNLTNNNFTYSDSNGYFRIKANPLDSLKFSHIGYNIKSKLTKNLKSKILLKSKIINLSQILIKNKKSGIVLLNKELKSKNSSLFGLSYTGKYAFKLKNNTTNKIFISKIEIPIKYKNGYFNRGKLIIQLYGAFNGKISDEPLSKVIYINNLNVKKKNIEINFKNLIIDRKTIFYLVMTRTLPAEFKIDKMTKFSLNPFVYFKKDDISNEAFFFMHNSSSEWKSGNELFENNYSELYTKIYGHTVEN